MCSRPLSHSAVAGGAMAWRMSPGAFACPSPPRTSLQGGTPHNNAPDHHGLDSPARLGPVKALRCASTPPGGGAYGLDWALARAMSRHLRDGRAALRITPERRDVNASTVDHAQHHRDDRPPHAPVLRLRHHRAGITRFAG